MSKLTIVRGVSGSGKSTYARAQTNALVVSRDDLRAALFGSADQDYYACDKAVLRRKESVVTEVQNAAIICGLGDGFDVIVDNTNTRTEFVDEIAALAEYSGAEVEVKVIETALATALERNRLRGQGGGRYVPESIIRRQYEELQSSLKEDVR